MSISDQKSGTRTKTSDSLRKREFIQAKRSSSMTTSKVLGQIVRQLAVDEEQNRLQFQTDDQLLGLFLSHRNELAFEELLRRHGAMVRAVCRRMLGSTTDADDAFQATFLVMVRRAG